MNHDFDFQYIRKTKKFNINKSIRNKFLVSFVFLTLLFLLFTIDVLAKSQFYPFSVIGDLFLILLLSVFTIRFLKKLKFSEFIVADSELAITSKILDFLYANNIEYEHISDRNVILIKGRNISSSSKIQEYVYILIDDNRILMNHMIHGTSLLNTGWYYAQRKQFGLLKGKIENLFPSQSQSNTFALS